MTTISTDITARARKRPVHRFLLWCARAIEAHAERQSRQAQILAFDALSDEELAARGLRRDQIAYHVFRDRFYC